MAFPREEVTIGPLVAEVSLSAALEDINPYRSLPSCTGRPHMSKQI
jgi:hypothetical protein